MKLKNILIPIILVLSFLSTEVYATTEFSQGFVKRESGLYVKCKQEKFVGDTITRDDLVVAEISNNKKINVIKDWQCNTIPAVLSAGNNEFEISFNGYREKLLITAQKKPIAEPVKPKIKQKNSIAVKPVAQKPELPTGCEITALTTVLNYYGYAVGKLTMADEFLDKGPLNATDYNTAFVGNPRSKHAYGCYAPVIVNAAKKYLSFAKSDLKVENISGRELEAHFEQIDKGIPVIIWGTINCKPGYYSATWYANGKKITWLAQEHCMVLTGYDRQKGVVYVSDPWLGVIKEYNMNIFKSRYNSLGKQAVIIY